MLDADSLSVSSEYASMGRERKAVLVGGAGACGAAASGSGESDVPTLAVLSPSAPHGRPLPAVERGVLGAGVKEVGPPAAPFAWSSWRIDIQ